MQNTLQKNIRFNNFRFIPRFEIKGNYLIKGMKMEGLKKIDNIFTRIEKTLSDGADEIIIDDIVASLYSRKFDIDFLKELSQFVNIPITFCGGIRNLNDIDLLLKNGADKISLNTITYYDKKFVSNAVKNYGSQCINCSIQVKKIHDIFYCYYLSGREKSHYTIDDKIIEINELGIGEISIFSIDFDGLEKELDKKLIKKINNKIDIPILYGGGITNLNDINFLINQGWRGAIISSSYHYGNLDINDIKSSLM